MPTLAFVTVAFGNQAVLYAIRERGRLWSSMPSGWLVLSSVVDVAIVSTLAVTGTLMGPLEGLAVASVAAAATEFGLGLDLIKRPLMRKLAIT